MHIEQNIPFLIIVALFALTRAIAGKASKARNAAEEARRQETPPITMPPINNGGSDTREIRKFLEALGQPQVSTPPRRVEPRVNQPPRPLAPVTPPASMTTFAPGVGRRQTKWPAKIQRVTPTIPTAEKPSSADTIPPLPANAPEPALALPTDAPALIASAPTRTPVLELLRSPAGLRNAVLLREIFGPPRALHDFA